MKKLIPYGLHAVRALLPALALLLACTGTWGQNIEGVPEGYWSETYTRKQGLPYDHVLDIKQDLKGFIWVATWDGLSRYDGYDFRNYYHKPEDSTAIPYFVVNAVLIDAFNNVWVLCHKCPLVKYDRAREQFEKSSFPGNNDYREKYIILGNNRDILWNFVPAENKIHRYAIAKNRFSSVSFEAGRELEQEEFPGQYRLGAQDNSGRFWFFRWCGDHYDFISGILKDDSTMVLEKLKPLPVDPDPSMNPATYPSDFDFFRDSAGKTWLFSRLGLFYLDTINNRFMPFTGNVEPETFSGKLYAIWYDPDGKAHVVIPRDTTHLVLSPPFPSSFQTVFVDASRNIWHGTVSTSRDHMGLTRLSKTPRYFRHHLTGPDEEGRLRPVFAIARDREGNLWAGTRGAGYVYKITPDGHEIKVGIPGLMRQNPVPRVRSLIADADTVWMGCTGSTLVGYDIKTGKSGLLPLGLKDSTGKSFNVPLHNILKDQQDILISGDAVFRFSPGTGKTRHLYSFPPGSTAFSLVRSRQNGYLAGITSNTVIALDSLLRETARYSIARDSFFVEHVCEDDSGDLWLALMGGGLGHIDRASRKGEILTSAEGLSNNTAYSVLPDKKGNIWVATNQGLSRFNPRTRQFRNFGKEDGLQIEEFNSDAWFLSPSGEMFFGGVGGLVRFFPEAITEAPSGNGGSPLLITGLRVSGEIRRFEKALYELDSLTLQKGDDNFQADFVSLCFSGADKIRYRYRLTGLDEAWTQTGSRNRNMNYAHLKPGIYRLDLEATNLSGEWTSGTSLLIRIPLRLHETWWFRVMAAALTLALPALLVVMYIRQIRSKAARKQDELALKSIRGQMNPHFIYNSLNSINYFILRNDRVSANRYISDFSRLIRSILTNMTEEFIPLDRELQSIRDYLQLEHLRFADKFTYDVRCNCPCDEEEVFIMPGMVQPFIENAIWHGIRNLENRQGTILVSFNFTGGKGALTCVVEDTGVGRKMAAKLNNLLPGKQSRGIKIIRERLQLINKMRNTGYCILIEDLLPAQEETGTRVTVDIPLKL